MGATEPVTENLELPTPVYKGTDRHVVHGGKNRIPHFEDEDRWETSRIQQHGRTMERAIMSDKDDHVLMNLELYAETKQKALNTFEMILQTSNSAVRGSGPLDSSLKILACLLRGKLLNEVDEWPQRTVALATHHQNYRALETR